MRAGALSRRAVTAAIVAIVAIGAGGAATASATELMTQSAIAFESGSDKPVQRDAGYRYAGFIGARYLRALVARDTSTVLNHGDGWWSKLDTFVDAAREKDFQPYLTITYKPDDWGGPAPMTMPTVQEFAYFCRFTAVHFQGRVRDYSVWNEPNGFFLPDGRGGRTKVPAATYGQFYRACRQEIQSIDSSARVYFGELVVGGQIACDYLANAMHSSIVTYTDGLALHPYQFGSTPTTRLPENCRGIGRLADWNSQASALAASFKTPAGGQVPLMVTEFGYCTPETLNCRDPPGDRSEANRASWIASAFSVAQANGVSLFSAYGLVKENPAEPWRWDVGIVNWDGTPTSSTIALRQASGTHDPPAFVDAPTNVTPGSVTLNGRVNPSGHRTTYYFEYGRTASYGQSTPAQSAGSGVGDVAANAAVNGLQHDTTYHYRLIATNKAGTTFSADQTFETAPADRFIQVMWPTGATRWQGYDLVTAAPPQPPVAGTPTAIVLSGLLHLYSRSTDGHLITTVNDNLGGRIWNPYDLTALSEGAWSTIADDPAATVVDGLPRIWAHRSTGHLLEFIYEPTGWRSYDLTQAAGAPLTTGRPSVLVIDGVPRVYARSATGGGLIEFAWSRQTGRLTWGNLRDLAGGPAVGSDPSAVLVNGSPQVYTHSTGGHLIATVADGVGGSTWNHYDVTSLTGGPSVAGDPAALVVDGAPRVYSISAAGRLIDHLYGRLGAGWGWSQWDLSAITGMPPQVGSPSAVLFGGSPRIYTRSDGNRLFDTLHGRLGTGWRWQSFDLSADANGVTIGSDPSAIVYDNHPRITFRGRFP